MFEDLLYKIRIVADADLAIKQHEGTTTAPVGTPQNPSHKIVTVSNIITFVRFILTTIFLYLFITSQDRYLALGLYAIAALTDFLDGYIARATNSVSWLGKIFDPIMDRYLLLTGVLGLVIRQEIPLWIGVAAIARDIYLLIGAIILKKYTSNPIEVVYVGKAATAFLMIGFSIMMIGSPSVAGLGVVDSPYFPGLGSKSDSLGLFVIYIGIVLSFITAVIYTMRGAQIIKQHDAMHKGT